MPADRTERRARHQSKPYVNDHARPTASSSVPRQAKAAGSAGPALKSLRPSTPEIIEISSDEDDTPLRIGKAARLSSALASIQKQNKASGSVITAADTSSRLPRDQAPSPDVQLRHLLCTLEDHVNCEVCMLKAWSPFILPCGHTFCKGCLVDWFHIALIDHLSTHPDYDAQEVIPQRLRTELAHPHLPDHLRSKYEREVAVIWSTTPQPPYSCPTCRVLVERKPVENYSVKHIVRTIAGVRGEACPQEDPLPRIHGRPLDGPFDGFFPYT